MRFIITLLALTPLAFAAPHGGHSHEEPVVTPQVLPYEELPSILPSTEPAAPPANPLFPAGAMQNMTKDCATTHPKKYGMLLFPGWQSLDAFGPLDILNTVAFKHKDMELSIIARDLDPKSTTVNATNKFFETVNPTHTLQDPLELDVLIVPGGMGTRKDVSAEIQYIREKFPQLQYLITVCTGAALAAQAGVLDGLQATTNKNAFEWVAGLPGSEKVHWQRKARWVDAGKVWTTSGISAGIDGTFAWVAKVFGEGVAADTAKMLEYVRITDPSNDPFAVPEPVASAVPETMPSAAPVVSASSAPAVVPVPTASGLPVVEPVPAPVATATY